MYSRTKDNPERPGSVGPVLVEVDPVEPVIRRVARRLWAHDGDPESGLNQRLALEPDPAVERDRQVLDEYENSSSLAPARCSLEVAPVRAREPPLVRLVGLLSSPGETLVAVQCLDFRSEPTVEVDDPRRARLEQCLDRPLRWNERRSRRQRRRWPLWARRVRMRLRCGSLDSTYWRLAPTSDEGLRMGSWIRSS